jgi:hypothetical protein
MSEVESRLKKALAENRRFCPRDGTAIRWKKTVGAFVCARSHLLYIDIQPEELRA